MFGVGAYRLTVEAGADKKPEPVAQTSVTDSHANDSIATATDLNKLKAAVLDARFDVVYRGAVEDVSDADFYRVTVPQMSGAVNLNVMVWATDGTLDPRVQIYNARGAAVPFRVLANDDGVMSVVVPNVGNGAYYIRVAGKPTGATGEYVLAADFNQFAIPPVGEIASGQLDSSASSATGSFVAEGGLYQFSLYTEPLATGSGTVALTGTDAAGNVVFTLDVASGDPAVTRSVYLPAGVYSLTYSYRASGQQAVPIRYHLAAVTLSEGVGTYAPTTTTTTATTTTIPPSGTTTTTSPTTYIAPIKTAWYGTWYFF